MNNIESSTRALLIGLLTCGLAVGWPAPAQAQAPVSAGEAEAEQRFRRGLDLYKDGDFAQSLIELKRAYSLAPNFRVLFNIGQVHFQLGEYAEALRAFEKYLSDGGAQVTAEKTESVKQDIEKLRLRVGRIEIVTKTAGAEVTIDDLPIGTTPLSELALVTAGRRRVVITWGGRSVTRVVEVAGGEVAKVEVDLATPAAPAATASVTGTQAPGAPPPEGASLVWVPWVVTGLLAVGTGITGGLALSASDELKKAKAESVGAAGQGAAAKQALDEKASQAKTLAAVTDVLGVAALAGLTVSIVVTATRKGAAEKTAVTWKTPFDKSPAASAGAPQVRFGVEPGGVRVIGSF